LDRVPYQATEFLALLVGDSGSQVLNLDQAFADEYDLSDFSNARHPGVTGRGRGGRSQIGETRKESLLACAVAKLSPEHTR
jgi:hypothetical protein